MKFHFWVDIISTLAFSLDLIWIREIFETGSIINAVKIARGSRASKIGVKSTKLIRFIKLIRILRLYKTA